MSFISTVSADDARGDTAELFREDVERLGYVANYTKAASHRPDVMRAWQQLNRSIKSNMDLRTYELATFAAAMQLRSSYCTLAHGQILKETFFDDAAVADIAGDFRDAGLSDADVAVMEFAQLVAADASAVTQAHVDRLRSVGLTDADIFDVAAAAAGRAFFSKMLDAVGTEPDAAFNATYGSDLRDRLTVGRSIEADG